MSLLPLALQKNSKLTTKISKYHKLASNLVSSKYSFVIFVVFLWLAASYIFYLRFPNNFLEPNFYAEDGHVLAENIIKYGVFDAFFSTFNGYYIWGLYILADFGVALNSLLFEAEFVNLAKSFAIASYGFFGLAVTLPVLLLRKYLRPMALVFIVLLGLFVPMQGSDYAIIGVLGNLKFAFIYVAFVLLVYRHLMPEGSRKVYLVDVALLVCAYTNVTVYFMLPFALLRYTPKIKTKNFHRKILADKTFLSLLVLGVALLPQLYIVYRDGIPVMPGYLDTPYDFGKTIEIFVSRSYLYAITFPINNVMSDVVVVILSIVLIGLGVLFSGKYRKIFIFGLVTIFLGTFLFVIKRTGISDSFIGYRSGGPDQFFYPQNWIFTFILSVVVVEMISKIKLFRYRTGIYLVLLAACVFFLAPKSGTYGANNFMSEQVGTIYVNAKKLCASDSSNFNIPLYPSPNVMFYENAQRSQLCSEDALNYYPKIVRFDLSPADNQYIAGLGEKNNFTQTFKSPQAKLDGVNVYLSTFTERVDTSFNFKLMDADCKNTIASVKMANKKIEDNEYHLIEFPVQTDSTDKTYCFSIASDPGSPSDPLAVQLSKPDVYIEGLTFINGQPSNRDVVFNIHYK